ncbi:MAG: pantetheine-phosphate adenylyltransferase [Lactobacillales bacterium]|jgi:pantetheine-phosphate adenylyltransferase|nr:pantetheine-phosphate adenylyltransferase [Lactobacillales bacterium]
MTKAIFPGTFDPFTIGHADILNRAEKLFDEVVVAILDNPEKNEQTTASERKAAIEKITKSKVIIEPLDLAVNVAKKHGAEVIIRSLRDQKDYEYEKNIFKYNHELAPEIETVFLLAQSEFEHISSSGVREVKKYGGDFERYLPKGEL